MYIDWKTSEAAPVKRALDFSEQGAKRKCRWENHEDKAIHEDVVAKMSLELRKNMDENQNEILSKSKTAASVITKYRLLYNGV